MKVKDGDGSGLWLVVRVSEGRRDDKAGEQQTLGSSLDEWLKEEGAKDPSLLPG